MKGRPAFVVARRHQARQRARRDRSRRRRAPRARRRRLDRRLHRLPAPARGAGGDRGRRRLRPARLPPAQRPARAGARAHQRARALPGAAAGLARRSRGAAVAGRDRRVVHLAREGAGARALLPGARPRRARRSSSRSSRSAAGASARAAWCATPTRVATRSSPSARPRSSWARPCSATAPRGCRGRRATSRRSCWLGEGGTRDARGARDAGQGGRAVRQMTVFTHRRPEEIAEAIAELSSAGRGGGRDAPLRRRGDGQARPRPGPALALDAPVKRDVELCVALGGDGTILRALQHYAGTGVPVFGINYGEIGFLATVEHERPPRRRRQGDAWRVRAAAPARDRGRAGGGRAAVGDQRPRDHEESRRARRRALLLARRRGSRPRALRRARGGHAGRLDGLQPRQRRSGDGLGGGGARGLVHRPALDDRASAGRRAGRSDHDHQRLAPAARRGGGRAAGRRGSLREGPRAPASSKTWARSRSCPGRPSTGACARSSAGSPAERAQATRASPWLATGPSWLIEAMKPSSWAREKRRWPPGVR